MPSTWPSVKIRSAIPPKNVGANISRDGDVGHMGYRDGLRERHIELHNSPLFAYPYVLVRLIRQSKWRPRNPPHPACRKNHTAHPRSKAPRHRRVMGLDSFGVASR